MIPGLRLLRRARADDRLVRCRHEVVPLRRSRSHSTWKGGVRPNVVTSIVEATAAGVGNGESVVQQMSGAVNVPEQSARATPDCFILTTACVATGPVG